MPFTCPKIILVGPNSIFQKSSSDQWGSKQLDLAQSNVQQISRKRVVNATRTSIQYSYLLW